MDVKLIIEMIEEEMLRSAQGRTQDVEVSNFLQAVEKVFPAELEIERQTEEDNLSRKQIIHYKGFGSLKDRHAIIVDLMARYPDLFKSAGGVAKRNDLFHRIPTTLVNRYGKPMYLQLNSGKGNQGFRLEQELQDLFAAAKITMHRAVANRSGADLSASIDFGTGVAYNLKIEVKSGFAKTSEMYQAGIKPENGIFVFKNPDRPVEEAIYDTNRRLGNDKVNLADLDGLPVDKRVVDTIFATKFDGYDLFYIKDGFYAADQVQAEGKYFYRFREKDKGRWMLVIYLAGGLQNADKVTYSELENTFIELQQKHGVTFTEEVD